MSIQAVASALALSGVSPTQKLVLICLANYADEDDRSWPSQKRLAQDSCLCERAVRSALAALQESGLIAREERRRDDGSRSSDLITLNLPLPARHAAPLAANAPPMRQQMPGVAAADAGLTTFEPSVEPLRAGSNEPAAHARPSTANEFEIWYAGYPHKVGKRDAQTAFAKARTRGTLEQLSEGLLAYVRTKPPDRPWCNPATWLNQDRWLDNPAPILTVIQSHEQPDQPSAKRLAREANLARAWAGSEIALGAGTQR